MAERLAYKEVVKLVEEFDDFFPTKLSTVMNLGAYAEILQKCLISVTNKNDENAGFISAYFSESNKRAILHFIVVKDKFKGIGIEDRLLKHFEKRLLENVGCKEMQVEVNFGDKKTIEFYEKHHYSFSRKASERTFYMNKSIG